MQGKVKYHEVVALLFVVIFYLLCFFLSLIDLLDRAFASVVLILCVYLVLRPVAFTHVANVVFANYFLYLVMPYSLFLFYRAFDIEYLLPWGLIHDWSSLSGQALFHYEVTFILFFLSAIYLFRKFNGFRLRTFHNHDGRSFALSKMGIWLIAVGVLIGCLGFMHLTGGVDAWLSNYSETYINNKAGVGLLNFTLIRLAHFLAFLAGWMVWKSNKRYSFLLWFVILIALLACIFLQGIKSRIPLVLFFFFLPKIMFSSISIRKVVFLALFLILLFMIGMYFRSGGFYGTPRLALEYLQSYFNTIFLHDLVLSSPPPAEVTSSMLRGFQKYLELFGEQVPRERYDLSVALTQRFFPSHWYIAGATQQWPIETDFYVTFDLSIFWIIPIFMYMFLMAWLRRIVFQGSPFFMFVYGSELVRLMSIFRSGLLTWDLPVLLCFYLLMYFFCKAVFVSFTYRKKI